MKKPLIRLAALLLALLFVIPTCGCKGGQNDDEKKGGEVVEDLGGYEFTVMDYHDGRWNKEKSGTPYADAWVQILDEVETAYNCTITPTYVAATEAFTTVQPEIAAGGKYADILITTQWQYGYFLGANLMLDLNELDVNWDNEWWNQDVREMGTYGGKSYVGLGSFIFDTSYTWLLYYNQAIWDELGLPDPYQMVDEHKWTQERFAEYCRMACEDRDNSGELDSLEDRFGMQGPTGDFCRAWFFALGGQYFKTDDKGRVSLACNNQRTFDIYDKMYNMVRKDKSVCKLSFENVALRTSTFANGGSLFYAYVPGVSGLQDMEDDWGVMPLPLYDENQKDYYSGVDHNSPVFGVAATNTDLYEVSVLLEALGRHAMILEDIFWPDYKETYWRHEEQDTRMVSEYVVGHGKHDLALIMQNCDGIFKSPMERVFQGVYGGGSADLSSWMDTVESMIATRLEEYFKYDVDAGETTEETE